MDRPPLEASGLRRTYGRLVALAGLDLTRRGRRVRRADRRQRQRQVDRGAHDRRAARAERRHGARLRPRPARASRTPRTRARRSRSSPTRRCSTTTSRSASTSSSSTLSHGVADDGVDERIDALLDRLGLDGARGLPAARALARHAPEDPARLRARSAPPRCSCSTSRSSASTRRRRRCCASCCSSASAPARRCCSPPTRWRSPTASPTARSCSTRARSPTQGPWAEVRERARGARMDVAVAGAGDRRLAGVRAWWRGAPPAAEPRPAARRRLHGRDHRRDLRRRWRTGPRARRSRRS